MIGEKRKSIFIHGLSWFLQVRGNPRHGRRGVDVRKHCHLHFKYCDEKAEEADTLVAEEG